MGKRALDRRGFTLVELMIVITIIGLITVLSIPNYSRFMQNWKLDGDAQQFASAMRTARATAVMKNIEVVFSFDPAANTYSYFEDNDRDGNHDANEYESAEYEMSKGVEITAFTLTSSIFTFGNKGSTPESGSVTLRNVNNKVKNIRIFGGTGNVSVE